MTIQHYIVSNRITGKVKIFKTSKGASNYMIKTDNDYGAYITTRKAVWG